MSAWIVALISSALTGGLLAWLYRYQAAREQRATDTERARQTEAAAQTRAHLEVVDERARARADSEHAEIDARPKATTTDGRLADLVRRSRE